MSYDMLSDSFAHSEGEILPRGVYAAFLLNARVYGEGPLPSVYITLGVLGRYVHVSWTAPKKFEGVTSDAFEKAQQGYAARVLHFCNAVGIDPAALQPGMDAAEAASTKSFRAELEPKKITVHHGDQEITRVSRNRRGYPLYNLRRAYAREE